MSNYWFSHIVLDPTDLERMFSNEDALMVYPVMNDELPEESVYEMAQVRQVLEMIPPREADFVELYYFQRVRQTTIAEMFNISQPTVCYHLQRATKRIRYLIGLPEYDPKQVEQELREFLTDERDVKIMLGLVRTTCQSDVAHELGESQGFVRHRYFRTIDKLKKMQGKEHLVKLFDYVAQNLGILKETHRSAWSDPVIYVVS